MDKKTFIRELRQGLSVLQEEELNDIVAEYEQHIDMKMKDGLAEEAAIADFGSLAELTANILEAYHVRADYAADQKKPFLEETGKAAREVLRQTEKGSRAVGQKAARGLRRVGLWLRGVWQFWERKFAKILSAGKLEGEAVSTESGQDVRGQSIGGQAVTCRSAGKRNAKGVRRRLSICLRGGWNWIAGALRKAGTLAVWSLRKLTKLTLWSLRHVKIWTLLALRLMWNFGCVCGCLLFASAGLVFLFLLGMLAVLWMQRYPLAGVTIGCLGVVLCAFSAAGLCLTLLRRRRGGTSRTGGFTDGCREQHSGQEETSAEMEEHSGWYQEMEGGQHA